MKVTIPSINPETGKTEMTEVELNPHEEKIEENKSE